MSMLLNSYRFLSGVQPITKVLTRTDGYTTNGGFSFDYVVPTGYTKCVAALLGSGYDAWQDGYYDDDGNYYPTSQNGGGGGAFISDVSFNVVAGQTLRANFGATLSGFYATQLQRLNPQTAPTQLGYAEDGLNSDGGYRVAATGDATGAGNSASGVAASGRAGGKGASGKTLSFTDTATGKVYTNGPSNQQPIGYGAGGYWINNPGGGQTGYDGGVGWIALQLA